MKRLRVGDMRAAGWRVRWRRVVRWRHAAAWCVVAGGTIAGGAGGLRAQGAAHGNPAGVEGAVPWRVDYSFIESRQDSSRDDDMTVLFLSRGLVMRRGGTEIRAREGILEHDFDAGRAAMRDGSDGAFPRRSVPAPAHRRVADEAELERRLASFLAASGQRPLQRADVRAPSGNELLIGLLRTLYLEGEVTVVHDGVEIMRAASLFASAIDDRVVMRDVELRLPSRDPDTGAMRLVTLRAPQLVRQGIRTTGRDVSVTTSIAAKPHFEFLSGEVELIERGDEFEVRGRENRLLVHGTKVSALPDIDFFSSQEPPVPLKGLSGGYGSKEGFRGEVQLGGNWNGVGGRLHEALTGDAAEDFRGRWRASVGYNEQRGIPLEGNLDYRGGDRYRGQLRAFLLEDQGRDRGPIPRDLDGSIVADSPRTMLRTQNRVRVGDETTLDVELFSAGDAGVFPEFFQGEWMETELPETRVHLRHGRDNWVSTLSGRFELDGIAYRDDRTLAPRFLEERPYGTFDVFSQPLFEVAEGVPLLFTASTSAGLLRFDYDRLAAAPGNEDALRLDQEVELAAPFRAGQFTVRPFLFGRATYYDDSPSGDDVGRFAYGGGVRVGTRLERTWKWDANGVARGLRHVLNPEFAVLHQTHVSKDPADVFQFDELDALNEDVTIRVGLLQRVQTSTASAGGDGGDRNEPIWLDLAQNFKPINDRDNGGEVLGLTEYELILRPGIDWPVPGWRAFVEGEYDWRRNDNRTFNAGTTFGKVLGVDWTVEYREDQVRDGVLLGSVGATLWSRWDASAGTSYDLESKDTLNYFASLARHDLDWTARIGLVYDNLRDETSFFVRFEPTLGGFVPARSRELDRGLRAWGSTLQGY